MKPPPDEIVLFHVLPRLPLKSLLRFRCVCKSWDSFIRDPSFVHLRQAANGTHGHLLFVSPDPAASDEEASQPHVFSAPLYGGQSDMAPASATHILAVPNLNYSEVRAQSVNGFLCIYPRRTAWLSSHADAFALIVNPTTRQVITLPGDASISKDFSVLTHFGYDPVRDEFKVVRLLMYDGSHEFKIFTVGDHSWRHINITPLTSLIPIPMNLLLSTKRGLCVNGAIHWSYSSGGSTFNSSAVVAFDLGSEQFRVIPAPYGYSYTGKLIPHCQFPDLVEIGGCLSLIGYGGSALNLWILKDYQAQLWEKKSIILPSGIRSQQHFIFPLCRVPTGEILLLPYFVPSRVRVIYHDIDKMSSRRVLVMEMPQPLRPHQISGEVDIFFYQESFRLLK